MNKRGIFFLAICVALCAVAVAALFLLVAGGPARAQGATRYVATSGSDDSNCADANFPCRTVQYAVDQAVGDDVIKVATGVYSDVSNYGGLAQVVYISKTVAIRGGYAAPGFADPPDPEANPTTLDAHQQGRVIYITGDISPTVEGLRITGGNAGGLGGVPWGDDTGGGVYVIAATATLCNDHVSANTAEYGGGLYLYHSDATLTGNTVSGNSASKSDTGAGGGLYLRESNAALKDNTISGNSAVDDGGGMVLWESDATLIGNTVSGNSVCITGACLGGAGGGLSLRGGAPTLVGNIVSGNTVGGGYASHGGGIELNGSDATLIANTVSGNTASYRGGGLGLWGGAPTLIGNTISGNSAPLGGGLQLMAFSDATLINNIVADNSGSEGSGLFLDGSSARLLHTTIVRNTGGDGSGVWVTNREFPYSSVALSNTVLVSHSVGIRVTAGSTATLEATLWGTGTWANETDWTGDGTISVGTVNVWGDPAFRQADLGNYHIARNSAAKDAGVNAGVTTDIDGQPRPYDSGYDIGADEYWPIYIYLPLVMHQSP